MVLSNAPAEQVHLEHLVQDGIQVVLNLCIMGASVLSWVSSSYRWLSCERSSPGGVAVRNLSRRFTNGVCCMLTQSEQQPCLKSREGVGKQACLKDSQDKGKWTLVSDLRQEPPPCP